MRQIGRKSRAETRHGAEISANSLAADPDRAISCPKQRPGTVQPVSANAED